MKNHYLPCPTVHERSTLYFTVNNLMRLCASDLDILEGNNRSKFDAASTTLRGRYDATLMLTKCTKERMRRDARVLREAIAQDKRTLALMRVPKSRR